MRRRSLFRNRNSAGVTPTYNFDIDEDSAFDVRRESDSVLRTFSYAEVIDGTYDTWLNGSFGALRNWEYNGLTLSNLSDTASQPRLFSNSGSPYVYDYNQAGNLSMSKVMDLSGDYIKSVILEDEENGNNQRANIILNGSGGNSFTVQFSIYGQGYVYLNKLGASLAADFSFPYSIDGVFDLFTFERKAGVVKVYKNNVELTLGVNDSTGSTSSIPENTFHFGDRGDGLGKINKYKHFGLLTGQDATDTDTSAYNQAVMNKYGIT